MKKIFASLMLLAALAGCNTIDKAISVVTTSNVPAKTIFVAINAFDVIEAPAIAYVSYCSVKVAPAGCDDGLIQTKISPAIDAGINAKKKLLPIIQANPGALGPVGTYNALVAATSTLTTYSSLYTAKK